MLNDFRAPVLDASCRGVINPWVQPTRDPSGESSKTLLLLLFCELPSRSFTRSLDLGFGHFDSDFVRFMDALINEEHPPMLDEPFTFGGNVYPLARICEGHSPGLFHVNLQGTQLIHLLDMTTDNNPHSLSSWTVVFCLEVHVYTWSLHDP